MSRKEVFGVGKVFQELDRKNSADIELLEKYGKSHDSYYGKLTNHRVIDAFRNKVNFEVGDVIKDTEKKSDDPEILFVRNIFDHLSNEEKSTLMDNLKNNLKSGDMLVVGQGECNERSTTNSEFRRLLDENFEKVSQVCDIPRSARRGGISRFPCCVFIKK